MPDTACPRCSGILNPVRARNAISRHDDKTLVCSGCGTDEAVLDFAALPVWPSFPAAMVDAGTASKIFRAALKES